MVSVPKDFNWPVASRGRLFRSNEDGEPSEVRLIHGALDEVVARGWIHLEQMDDNNWWMNICGQRIVLHSRGKITAHWDIDDAQEVQREE